MHPRIYREFERICSEKKTEGNILEVGAIPSDRSLLNMKSLKNASKKTGINLDGPCHYHDFHILKGNANHMTCFEDETFDVVLCNATLEHDKFFWKSIAEFKRVAKPGGLIVICAPGYIKLACEKFFIFKLLRKIRLFKSIAASTLTFHVHRSPGDYYRFGTQAFEEVFFREMTDVNVYSIMVPPRIIGYARKPR